MADPFIGEVRIWANNFSPRGWAYCDGQLMAISQNPALFSIIGDMYGGNGTSNFGVPNLMGATVMGAGRGPGLTSYQISEDGGFDTISLVESQLPSHDHTLNGYKSMGDKAVPDDESMLGFRSDGAGFSIYQYTTPDNFATMAPEIVSLAGASDGHENRQPYLAIPFCIALLGYYPPRN